MFQYLFVFSILASFWRKIQNFVKIGWDVLKTLTPHAFPRPFFPTSFTFPCLISIQNSQVLLWLLGQKESAMGQFIPFIPWLSPCSVLLKIWVGEPLSGRVGRLSKSAPKKKKSWRKLWGLFFFHETTSPFCPFFFFIDSTTPKSQELMKMVELISNIPNSRCNLLGIDL